MCGYFVSVRGDCAMSRNGKVGKVRLDGEFQNERIDLAVAISLYAEDMLLCAV